MNNSAPNDTNTNCEFIEQLLLMPFYRILTWAQLLIVFAIFGFISALKFFYLRSKITIHGNFMILFANIVFIHLINAFFWGASIVRYKFLTYIYSSNCELLTPVWLAFLLGSPSYIYLVAYSGIHFSIMAERFRATVFARNYENERFTFGWICVLISWSVSFVYMFCVIFTALMDTDAFAKPLGLISLTSKSYNAQGIVCSYYAILALLIITAIGDVWVMRINKRLRNRVSDHWSYSVSTNYQVKENLTVMRLVLPLDISYAILFGIYLLIGIILRRFRVEMSEINYVAFYNAAVTEPRQDQSAEDNSADGTIWLMDNSALREFTKDNSYNG
ncbi:hypothetical protein niasHT_008183 [Heterodera trifolii]|uniref:G-protein coupled receptors family 1 profile domain-containing protein n=1 Tax=Heterodera trifolii TaxID=157864 RepID=A0ABD2LUB0_9BILA